MFLITYSEPANFFAFGGLAGEFLPSIHLYITILIYCLNTYLILITPEKLTYIK